MKNEFYSTESAENFETKWLCVLLIDVSASMSDHALAVLNDELRNLYKLFQDDGSLELCLMTYGQDVRIIQEPSVVQDNEPHQVKRDADTLRALECAIQKIYTRKCWYKETGQTFWRPLIVHVTIEAQTELFYSDIFEQMRVDISNKRYDYLKYGMNGSIVFANQYGEYGVKWAKDNLSKIIYYSHPKIQYWLADAEAPMPNESEIKILERYNYYKNK